jgi:putative phage-type endonuclease
MILELEKRIIKCAQGTPEWHAARCGKVTASKVADIMRQGKGGAPSAMRETYMGVLIAERLSGVQEEGGYTSGPMEHGKEHEEAAAKLYGFINDAEIEAIGMVVHPTIPMAAASTDRLIKVNGVAEGLLEIKCPNTSTHLNFLKGGPIKPDYIAQMQWGMACVGPECKWADFVSFDPRLPPKMRLKQRRVMRESTKILDMEIAVRAFIKEIDEAIAELNALFQEAA